METTFPLFFAAAVGFSHAFEADHLVAVSNIVTKRDKLALAIKDGIYWGFGHTSTIFLIGLLIIVGRVTFLDGYFGYFEAVVGLMLVALGVYRLYRYFRVCLEAAFEDKKWQFFDEMRRLLKCIPKGTDEKGNEISSKKGRFLAQRVASKHTLNRRRQPARLIDGEGNHHLAYGVGLVHGLAGSGAMILLVMTEIQGGFNSMMYLLIFGFGSVVGMLVAAGIFSLPFSKRIAGNRSLQLGLVVLSSLLCIGYGAFVVIENLGH